MKMGLRLRSVFFFLFLLILLIGILIGTFFLTAWLYHAIGYTPPLFLAQMINSLLSVLLFAFIVVRLVSWMSSRPEVKRGRMGVFEPIQQVLGQIAKGDFRVRLNPITEVNPITSELAKSVNQMVEELDQMEHMRQEFISNVSHEIQSPLTSIRGFAQALRDEQLSVEQRHHYLAIIETESRRLSRMTDNMLKLASLESEYMKIEPKRYQLDAQMRTLILACEPHWIRKNIEMDVGLEAVEIWADEDLLSQVWSNLLHNSIKFTPEGGNVGVEVRWKEGQIECKITDTGMGIPQEAQAHVFERFYQVDQSRTWSREGSGLGLAIAKKIVELHRGTIEVISQPGAGATFVVCLPQE